MPQTRISEKAQGQGIENISQLQIRAGVSMNTARRYWYGTQDGTPDGPRLDVVSIRILRAIGDALGVDYRELLEDGQTLQAAA